MKSSYVFIVIIFIAILGGAFWYLNRSLTTAPSNPSVELPQNNLPNTSPVTTVPNAAPSATTTNVANGSVSNAPLTLKIYTHDNKTMLVRDFIHNGETVPDTVNPGYYYLAGSIGYCLGNGTCPSGYQTSDFIVTFHAPDSAFNVTLLSEPLGTTRAKAELFLLDRLGVSAAQLCTLNYWVGVPDSVSAVYTNKNLGFSFCPGATAL